MPQYRDANDPQGHLVDVLDLPSLRDELAAGFVCVGCGQPLIAKTKGERREKHFAHKVVTPTCTEETYLHKLAKQAFFDEYQHCLDHQEPYEIELAHPATCSAYQELLGENCSLFVTKTHDLTRFYRVLKLEQRDGSFVPDLLLYHPEHPERPLLYIEIAVTHFLSDQKVSSDRRIVEIPIESEADIAKIRRHRLTPADARFVNFQPSLQPVGATECTCAQQVFNGLVVYSSGKSFLLNDTLAAIDAEYRRSSTRANASFCNGAASWRKECEGGYLGGWCTRLRIRAFPSVTATCAGTWVRTRRGTRKLPFSASGSGSPAAPTRLRNGRTSALRSRPSPLVAFSASFDPFQLERSWNKEQGERLQMPCQRMIRNLLNECAGNADARFQPDI